MHTFQVVKNTSNSKLGNEVATIATDSTSCPSNCVLSKPQPGYKKSPCYGEHGPISWQWKRLNNGTLSTAIVQSELYKWVKSLPLGKLVRNNTVGDLPANNGAIDKAHFNKLGSIAKKRKLDIFGFTHHLQTDENLDLLVSGYASGLVMNASTDTFQQAIQLKKARPEVSSVVIAKSGYAKKSQYIKGVHFVQCPATWHKSITCQDCRICTKGNRKEVIVFPAHGTGRYSTDKLITKLDNLIPVLELAS